MRLYGAGEFAWPLIVDDGQSKRKDADATESFERPTHARRLEALCDDVLAAGLNNPAADQKPLAPIADTAHAPGTVLETGAVS